MLDHVVLDLEIAHEIGGPEGYIWDDTDRLGVSCAVLYECRTDRFKVYSSARDLHALRFRLQDAHRITTFNGWKFDLPVLYGLPGRQRVISLAWSSDDVLRRIWSAVGLDPDVFTNDHKGFGLDVICRSTLGRGKIGYGGDAPRWYRDGQWARLVTYCLDDVTLTRDLCQFIDRYGYVLTPAGRLALPPWIETPRPPEPPGDLANTHQVAP